MRLNFPFSLWLLSQFHPFLTLSCRNHHFGPVFQEFEKKEHKLKARAATNLAFLYSLEGNSSSAEHYADLAMSTDKYSAQALVNKVCYVMLFCCVMLCYVMLSSQTS